MSTKLAKKFSEAYQIPINDVVIPFLEAKIDRNGDKEYNFRELCSYLPGTTYLTHGIHSYPAKFIPHIPHYIIKHFTDPSDYILDPFCGSGTALVEARLLGRNSYGIDINPLGRLITKIKTSTFSKNELNSAKDAFLKMVRYFKGDPMVVEFPNKDHWFEKYVQKDLGIIKACLEKIKSKVSPQAFNFLQVCFSAIIRKVANADPKISKPFISKHMRDLIKEGKRELKTFTYLEESIENYAERLLDFNKQLKQLRFLEIPNTKAIILEDSDARKINLKDKCIDLIITSPPYANAQEYFRSIKLELFWLGLADNNTIQDLKKQLVGTEAISAEEYTNIHQFGIKELDKALEKIYKVDRRRSYIVYKYFVDMRKSIRECYRVLKTGKHFAILIGDNVIRDIPVATHEFIINIAEDIGFKTYKVGYDRIKARGLAPQRNHTAGLIEVEWMLIFRKPVV